MKEYQYSPSPEKKEREPKPKIIQIIRPIVLHEKIGEDLYSNRGEFTIILDKGAKEIKKTFSYEFIRSMKDLEDPNFKFDIIIKDKDTDEVFFNLGKTGDIKQENLSKAEKRAIHALEHNIATAAKVANDIRHSDPEKKFDWEKHKSSGAFNRNYDNLNKEEVKAFLYPPTSSGLDYNKK